jgi:hypothetical protein
MKIAVQLASSVHHLRSTAFRDYTPVNVVLVAHDARPGELPRRQRDQPLRPRRPLPAHLRRRRAADAHHPERETRRVAGGRLAPRPSDAGFKVALRLYSPSPRSRNAPGSHHRSTASTSGDDGCCFGKSGSGEGPPAQGASPGHDLTAFATRGWVAIRGGCAMLLHQLRRDRRQEPRRPATSAGLSRST